MSLNVAKLKIIQDIEDRLIDEVSSLDSIRIQLMQLLHTNSLQEREVRYSELIYDESTELLVKTIESLSTNPRIQDYQNQVNRIYKFRVDSATKDTLFEITESPWIVHAEVVGNILERSNYNKDLLRPFYNKALPKHLRRNVWRALLTYPEAEEEYINLFKEARWKTLSLNEVEITKKSVELLSEHCHSLAFNEKIVTAMKVVLSYVEKIMQRRLPDYMYYILLPIMYTLTDLTASLPRLVGICLKMVEIQTTIWLNNKDHSATEVFFKCLDQVNPSISTKIKSLIDLQYQENKVKLENFVRPFLSRLGSGFFNIEATCVVFDQLIMINTLNKMHYIFALSLQYLAPKLMECDHWDDFLGTFFKEIRKISPLDVENLLEMLPESEDIETKVKVPPEYKGQEYLDYVLQAQEFEQEQKQLKVHELGQLLSAKRILADDIVLGMHQQKMMKANLMEQALNKSKEFPTRRANGKKGTLINANLTRISNHSKKSEPSLIFNNTKEIVNLSQSRDVFIQENSFPKMPTQKSNAKEPSILPKNSIFQNTSLDEGQKFPKNQSINDTSGFKNSGLEDSSMVKNFGTFKSPNDTSFVNVNNTKRGSEDKVMSPILNSDQDLFNNSMKNLKKMPSFSKEIVPTPEPILNSARRGSILDDLKSPVLPSSKRSPEKKDPNELPDISYLEGGLLAVPDLKSMKPGLLDGFDD